VEWNHLDRGEGRMDGCQYVFHCGRSTCVLAWVRGEISIEKEVDFQQDNNNKHTSKKANKVDERQKGHSSGPA